ncbi:ribonuclease P protein component [Macrococcus lamae]|uniref:Ribonuclease P protein component n=1 Tax=Macrococcus lamae TaxID=198484 RepID=A0A4R6BU40_9STAP|nr:ribonuclease P protein component [Macrococcus lamae]TDM10424.1 ribonuclease P protein component [Macrococcus lamae]
MEKNYRIKKNEDFQTIYKSGRSVANRQFIVYRYDAHKHEHFRLGISVSKKLGNAVVRNRIKRSIRESFNKHKADIVAADFIVIARKPASEMSVEEINSSLEHVMKIAKGYNKRIK